MTNHPACQLSLKFIVSSHFSLPNSPGSKSGRPGGRYTRPELKTHQHYAQNWQLNKQYNLDSAVYLRYRKTRHVPSFVPKWRPHDKMVTLEHTYKCHRYVNIYRESILCKWLVNLFISIDTAYIYCICAHKSGTQYLFDVWQMDSNNKSDSVDSYIAFNWPITNNQQHVTTVK